METSGNKTYEVKLRILGNEVFALALTSTSDSNRWVAIGLITTFATLTVLGAYGEKIISLYRYLIS